MWSAILVPAVLRHCGPGIHRTNRHFGQCEAGAPPGHSTQVSQGLDRDVAPPGGCPVDWASLRADPGRARPGRCGDASGRPCSGLRVSTPDLFGMRPQHTPLAASYRKTWATGRVGGAKVVLGRVDV